MDLTTPKQRKYFDEVLRLHFEEGLGVDRISRRVPLAASTIGKWISQYKSVHNLHNIDAVFEFTNSEIIRMHKSGMTIREIGKELGISKTTVWKRITKFAPNIKEQDMHTETKFLTNEEAQARIAELEAKLKAAELARDAYNEMINVAEARFNIPIRKKAGAKQ